MTRFKAPVNYNKPSGRFTGRFPNMPMGVQLLSDWVVHKFNFFRVADLPVTTVGWTITATGAGAATLTDDVFPPGVNLTNAAADNDSLELQFTATDGTGEFLNPPTDCPIYFEIMLSLNDANGDDSSVEQADVFVGLCTTDTTVIDGATDFIGFLKRDLTDDSTGRINFVCGDAGGAAGALVDQFVSATGWVALNPDAIATSGTDAAAALHRAQKVLGAGELIKLAFLLEPTGDGANGRAWAWVNDALTSNSPMDVTGFVPNEALCVTVAVQNGEAVAKVLTVYNIVAAQSIYDDSNVLLGVPAA